MLPFTGVGAAYAAIIKQRLALVVTNENYAPELYPLQYTHADGRIVAAALKEIGFNVRVLRDGSISRFEQAFEDFLAEVRAAGPDTVAFFYFSGHSVPRWADNTNWLILNEVLPEARKDREIIERSVAKIGVPIAGVTRRLASLPTRASFVIVDSHLDAAEPALIEPAVKAGKSLMLVTQGRPGLQAADSNDFSTALAGALLTPGLEAQAVFKQVQVQVAEKTNGKQVPWFDGRLATAFYFLPPRGQGQMPIPASAPMSPDEREQVEHTLWKAIRDSRDAESYRGYLEKFPQGDFAEIAKLRIDKLARMQLDANARRIALVIGNAKYAGAGVLENTLNDAKEVAAALREIGFAEVVEKHDIGRTDMLAALRTFGESAASAEWAVIYYAGHGIEIGGLNYLIPVDAKLENEKDAEDEAVPVTRIFDRLADSKAIRIVILDACRDNPFARSVRSGAKRSGGLAKMEADTGTLIALAADPGQPAYDGDGDPAKKNSPYTRALLQHIREPRLDVRLMFGKVYDSMLESMKGKQHPWIQAKLGGRELYFNPR
jgi:uncharacterized caspase-like protein